MKEKIQNKELNPEALRRQLDKIQTRLERAEKTLMICQQVAGKENLTEILWLLVDLTVSELGAERGSLFLNDASTANCTPALLKEISHGKFVS